MSEEHQDQHQDQGHQDQEKAWRAGQVWEKTKQNAKGKGRDALVAIGGGLAALGGWMAVNAFSSSDSEGEDPADQQATVHEPEPDSL